MYAQTRVDVIFVQLLKASMVPSDNLLLITQVCKRCLYMYVKFENFSLKLTMKQVPLGTMSATTDWVLLTCVIHVCTYYSVLPKQNSRHDRRAWCGWSL